MITSNAQQDPREDQRVGTFRVQHCINSTLHVTGRRAAHLQHFERLHLHFTVYLEHCVNTSLLFVSMASLVRRQCTEVHLAS